MRGACRRRRAGARLLGPGGCAALLGLGVGMSLGLAGPALADTAANVVGPRVDAGGGEAVYQHVCQGCHMAAGQGAVGAGAGFPAFKGNSKLASSGYPVYVVLNGLGGMPWFNGTLSDTQIAGVVNYIRTHFGNSYTDAVSPADVASERGPAPNLER